MGDYTVEAYECLIRKLKKQIREFDDEHQQEVYLWIQKENKIYEILIKKLGYVEAHRIAALLDEFHKKEMGSVYGHVEGFEERYEHLAPKEMKK